MSRVVPQLVLVVSWCVVLCANRIAVAQVTLHSDNFASSGGGSQKNIVRDGDGVLYCVSIRETVDGDRELIVQSSADGGETWETEPVVLNDESSGRNAPQPTNGCAVAIDDLGVLHVLWASYHYPSSYRQFYRQWDPSSGDVSEVLDVSALSGAGLTARTAAMSIAVDEDGTVWLVAHGPQSWVEMLARSVEPHASDLTFVDAGRISPSASAQSTQIVIDVEGRVHCSFYRNTGNGQYEHRIFHPIDGWGESINLGNVEAPNDYWGGLAADELGNVHALIAEDVSSGSAVWRFAYRRWDLEGGWTESSTLFEAELDQHAGIANYKIVAIACNESNGEVTVLFRDLTREGLLGLVSKSLDDESFLGFRPLAPPTTSQHAYYLPTIRGSLFPESNRTSAGLHVTWQHRPAAGERPFSLMFAAPDGVPDPGFRRGDADDDARFGLSDAVFTFSALFIPGSPFPGCRDASDSNDDGQINLSDGVFSLNGLFSGGPPPPSPGSAVCGVDPTADDLGCEGFASCSAR
jgi:hypothetical protein